jgi:hypothetical protein
VAPIRTLREAPRRSGERRRITSDPMALRGLPPATRARLRELAQLALEQLGIRETDTFIEDEMVSQFTELSRGVPEGPDRARRLLAAIERTIEEYVAR